jgi:hypothetical protein
VANPEAHRALEIDDRYPCACTILAFSHALQQKWPAAPTSDATLQQYAGAYLTPSGGKVEVALQPGNGLSIRGRAFGRRAAAAEPH